MTLNRKEKDAFLVDWRKSHGACFWCGHSFGKVGGARASLEHFIPLSRGGYDHIDNLVWAHESCNGYRANRWPTDDEIRRYLAIRGDVARTNLVHFSRRLELMIGGLSVAQARKATRILSVSERTS